MSTTRDKSLAAKLAKFRANYAPCPCGSGKKYKFCCRDRWSELSKRCVDKRVPGTASYL